MSKDSLVEDVVRKSMLIRPSGRSTDFIAPSFGQGCLFNCNYCYCKRHTPEGVTIASNHWDILTMINNHSMFAVVDKPNQTHNSLISYDIGCNEDLALHAKYHKWLDIFEFFRTHPRAMGSFATKYVNTDLLSYNPERKVRIRFSLMPQEYSDILEPGTSKIQTRIHAINDFIKAGYDVHINFSPVIVTEGWVDKYRELFQLVNQIVFPANKEFVKCEVIFLTHNKEKHEYNLKHELPGEHLLWRPAIQEYKVSQYGGVNLRYAASKKVHYVEIFKGLAQEVIPWCKIRYCF